MGRFIGSDIHRDFTQVAVVEDGLVTDWGRVDGPPQALREFAAGLRPDDQVALEATSNARTVAVRPGGDLQSGQDPGDRRDEGQDRQGRRP
ncbi:hypothetical protein ABZ357_05140 [Streptomyces sp. NPDC005917]|uniref:hypothetical protein n=1 Tax=unclassified Streptomyces TaxID=2593676 RepID=UPI0033E441CE